MVRVLPRRVENVVGLHHVVHHAALADLLAPKLLRSRQVLSVIVTKVIVADNGGWLPEKEITLIE